ncbi:MAG: exo-alpha-sialidase [Anaerolineae bacterium]|nr:exo-alpha-sialidase [Anaerolineae bacterium]
MKTRMLITTFILLALLAVTSVQSGAAAAQTYDITTLAGKVASLNGTDGLQIRFSAFIEEEANMEESYPAPSAPITPNFVLSSPLDGNTILFPNVTVNQDTAAAPQNETAIAVDPNNPNRIVAAANDYVTRTWACDVNGTPCSALGDGYSGTYYSNDGGQTWSGVSSDPQHLGTLIPGVTRLAGGQYDAGGDPALAFDSRGNVYYAGLGFNRASAPNTVAVNKGTFDAGDHLHWSMPVFINQTTAPSTLNDKEWIAADWHVSSPYRDRVYVSWTRFLFNPVQGNYTQSPIFFAYSSDGGQTFSEPQNISGNVLYDQGSRPIVGYDGTVYVIFEGAKRLSTLDATYIVKSTDGGATFSKPVKIADVQDVIPLANTAFRVNSFPAGAPAPNGDLYVAWSTLMSDSGGLCPTRTNKNCHSTTVYSKSKDGGMTWSAPMPIFPALDASNRTATGYPAADGLTAPAPRRVDTLWPGVAVSPSGTVYMSAYAADIVSPWQICDAGPVPPVGRIACDTLGGYIHNARLNYYVTNIGLSSVEKVSTNPINTRHGFGGGFIGDYTDLSVGADNIYHALWTDTNNKQNVVWFYGAEFVPTLINQEDVVAASGILP